MIELEKNYDAQEHETDVYQKWLDSGYFNPDNLPDAENREPYTITMPPPNANAPLHVGHALGLTIQDILIRYNRMRGKKTLWIPGTDHAGFETQVVFEKVLAKDKRSRFQMTRDEFYEETMEFVQKNKHISEEGIKRLGASCDWSRNMFTLDPDIIKVVYETFAQMYKDGLVYKAGRICNWCPKHQTGLADLETKHEERTDTFYYFQYGPFVIGTARPETKFGDKYIVVHPEDKRYAQYEHGQQIDVEWINGPITATVIKDSAVDMEFGTGAMTITPWHDATDFEIAQRHDLDMEQIIDERGKLLPIAQEFSGMKIEDAREKIVEKLDGKGLFLKEKTDDQYKHSVQTCYKCGRTIEPQIIPQWYINMTSKLLDGRPSLRDMAMEAVNSDSVEITNEKFKKVFSHWMENIRDWPISRQIWWGIPIPIKYCLDCDETILDTENSVTKCIKCNSNNLKSEEDTFDTWFSSGQWPFATLMALDDKNSTEDFKTFFPNQVMETGWDILFFWVARMIMLSYYRTKLPPFEKVFLHGLVRDKDRQKMSKSKGNVVDPLGVIDTYGTDALRFALVFSTAGGNDIPLAEEKIKGMKHFGNKLWNISRFILGNVESLEPGAFKPITDADKLIIERLSDVHKEVTDNLENLRLHEAAQAIYQFTWRDFADVYIESSKAQLDNQDHKQNTQAILLHVLENILIMLHPFMPFVTEVIWSKMQKENLLIVEDWRK